jgi:ABC-2 type transport system ATP-binding protein
VSPTSWAERPEGTTVSAPAPVRPVLAEKAAAPAAAGDRPISPAVHTIGLRKQYRRTTALEGLSMTVERGEIFGFLGPNGAGKTTAVKLLLGLVHPSGGEAMVLGAPAGDVETRRRIGYLPELFRFQGWLSAREVLLLHCRLLRLPKDRWSGLVGEVLATIGLKERQDDKVAGFSKGMQQRLGLAVALLGEPELVVLDEPTSALDPVGRHHVREIIRQLRSRGATVFLNTHLLEEAEHVCDRVAVIDKGTAIATGRLDELRVGQSSARFRVGGLGEGWRSALHRFGRWQERDGWLVLEGIEPSRIPEVVDELVALGGRVQAVIPEHQSLEARFLELLAER